MGELPELETIIGYRFTDTKVAREALTHRSCKEPFNNERLEFLGDAVLDLVVGEYLYERLPEAREGELSKIRASLVNESGFKKLAETIELGRFLYISPAEENNHGREKPSILSGAFEALMGAVYLDGGLDAVTQIIKGLLVKVYPKIDLGSLFKDYKTQLQEMTQATDGVTPEYQLLGSSGPDHQKEFEVAVSLSGRTLATGKGHSKKSAQQAAAHTAMTLLKKEQQ